MSTDSLILPQAVKLNSEQLSSEFSQKARKQRLKKRNAVLRAKASQLRKNHNQQSCENKL